MNRKVDLNRAGYQPLEKVAIAETGTIVHLEWFGSIRVFRVVSKDGDVAHWATNDLTMNELVRLELAEYCWSIEEYHRTLKQCCNTEKCQCRSARAQRNQIGKAIRAFARLWWNFYHTGVIWHEATTEITREAVRRYRTNLGYRLGGTA